MTEARESTIDINAVERELTSLWQQASSDEEGGVIRSSTLNLVVFAPAESNLSEIDDLMAEITAAHPSRAVLLLIDRQGKEPVITAEVTSRCTLPTATSKQVCCEQVTIRAGGERIDEVPSAVAPLLIPDLPVYLWWRAVPRLQDKILFRRLVELSDRVIIDSARFNEPANDLAGLGAILRDSPKWTAVSDLNWARLTAWRALLAGFYDVREYRPLLDKLSRVIIEHSPPEGASTPISSRALLLGGWLASRLAWKPRGRNHAENASQFNFEGSGSDIVLEFRPTERKIEPGRIAKVTLQSAADQSASFTVRRSTDSTRIETEVRFGETSRGQRVLGYESLSEAALLIKELDILGNDRVYEQAVMGAAQLLA